MTEMTTAHPEDTNRSALCRVATAHRAVMAPEAVLITMSIALLKAEEAAADTVAAMVHLRKVAMVVPRAVTAPPAEVATARVATEKVVMARAAAAVSKAVTVLWAVALRTIAITRAPLHARTIAVAWARDRLSNVVRVVTRMTAATLKADAVSVTAT